MFLVWSILFFSDEEATARIYLFQQEWADFNQFLNKNRKWPYWCVMEHDNSYFKFYLSSSFVSLRCLGHVEYFSAKVQVLFLWLFAKKDKNIKDPWWKRLVFEEKACSFKGFQNLLWEYCWLFNSCLCYLTYTIKLFNFHAGICILRYHL